MGDGDLVISFRTKGEAESFIKSLKGAKLSAEELAQAVVKAGGALGDVFDNAYRLDIGAKVGGLNELKGLKRTLTETEQATLELIRAIEKKNKADQGSLTNIRQSLNQAKQKLASMSQENAKYQEQTLRVNQLTEALKRAQGVEVGSVADITGNIKDLERRLQLENLSAQARQRLTDEINEYNVAAQRARGIEEGSIADLQQRQQQQDRLAQSLRVGSAAQVQAAKNAKALGDQIAAATPKTLTLIGAFNKLATIQAGLLAITSAFGTITGSIGQVTKRLKNIESFELALKNVGFSASETSSFFLEAANTATRLGAPLEQIEKSYKRIAPTLKFVGATTQETDDFIEGLAARTTVLGLSAEESSRYMEAFAQAMSKGKLQSEELNQQISELDGSFRGQLADSLGVSIEQLTELVENGQITSKVLLDAFLNMENGAEALAGKLEAGVGTIQQLQNNINTFNVQTLQQVGKSIEPGIRAFLQAGEAFAKLVNQIANSELGALLAELFNQIGNITKIVIQGFSALVSVANIVIGPLAAIIKVFSPFIALLITLKTASLVAAAAQSGLATAMLYLKAVTGGSLFNVQALTLAFTRLTAAASAFKAGQYGNAILSLGSAIGNAVKAMNIGVVNSFGAAITRLFAAFRAGTIIDKAGFALQNFSQFSAGVAESLKPLLFNLGRAGNVATAFGQRLRKNIGDFFSFKKAADGTKVSYQGVGRAASDAVVDISATAKTISSEAIPALGRVGKTAGLANGQLGSGASAAFRFGRSLLSIGKATGILAIVTTAAQGLLQVFDGLSQGGDQAKQPVAELEGTLRQLGIETQTTRGAWLGFLDDLRNTPIIKQVADFIDILGDKLKAFGLALGGDRGLGNLRGKFEDIEKAAKKAGVGGLDDFSNASKLSKKEAIGLTGGLRATEKAYQETAANIEEQIAALKKSGGATQDQIAVLEMQKKAAQQGADKANYYASEWEKATEKQRSSADAIEETKDALETVKAAQIQYFNSIDTDKQVQLNALQDQLNKGLISGSSYASQSAAIQDQATNQKIAAIQKEKAALEERSKTQATKDYAAYRRIQELTQQEQALRSGAAVQLKKLSDEELKAIKDRQDALAALGEAYQDAADQASSALDDLGTGVGDALEKLSSAIEREAVINFSITGDQSFLTQSLDNQAKILDFQYTIGALKVKQQQAEKNFELELQKLKIQTALIEAQSAAAGGDQIAQQTVAALQQQLAIIPQIQSANQITSDAALIGLRAETQEKQAQLNVAREAQGLPPVNIVAPGSAQSLQGEFDTVYSKAKTAAGELGNVATTSLTKGTNALSGGVTKLGTAVAGTETTAKQAGSAFDAAVSNLQKGLEKLSAGELAKGVEQAGKKGAEGFNKEASKSRGIIQSAVEAGKGIGQQFLNAINPIKLMQNEVKMVTSLVGALSGAVGRMPTGGGRRALGGPVAGGQTYLVNDGGGREAFMNKSGQISMLPAGRNIRWRAPGDGFVLPAPMTESLVQNSKINAKIAAVSNSSANRVHSGYSSGLSNSGNLIQQMGAMMGGATTQRITNNVTIQSQSPVMDASKIMANVARLRARRGIRG